MLQHRRLIAVALTLVGVAATMSLATSIMRPQTAMRVAERKSGSDEGWQAVAPGRVEPLSGETKITPLIPGLVGEVLVKANDKVFVGEPLIRLQDDEVRGRLAAADAQVALRQRARDDQHASGKEADLRRAEDALSDAETDVFDARAAVDASAIARRVGGGTDADLGPARAALARAQEQQRTRAAALRALEAASPLPSQADAMLKVARAERSVARSAVDKLTIRAPIAGTILQVNARVGETATPATPLVLIGDLSALRVRAELDDHDVGNIKVGQSVVVRASAFPGREFAGKVASIAPTVEPGSIGARGPRDQTDVDVVIVMINLTDPGPLASGMKVDAYFPRNEHVRQ
jgi:HlyD family secretion protein